MTTITTLIPHDKALHCLGGTLLFASIYTLAFVYGLPLPLAAIAAIAICTFIAIAKELYDAAHPQTHTADWRDAVATIVGGGLGLLCAALSFV
jgi:hypothetical protein